MKFCEIPHSDLRVSLIGLGTMTYGEQNTQEEAFEQMDYAREAGVNLFDTAEMYPVPPVAETVHATETIIGSWLAARPGAREDTVIATKVAGPSPHMTYIRGGSRLNRHHIERALEGSLQRLKTDYVDLYQLHWPDRQVPLFGGRDYSPPKGDDAVPVEETLAVLADCVKSGKVRHIGISNETPWGTMRFLQAAKELDLPRMITIQNSYNLLNRTYDGGLSEISHYEGIKLLAYSPLAFGRLSGKYRGGVLPEGARLTRWERFARYNGPTADAAIEEYASIAKDAGLSLTQLSLAWINQRPHLGSNLIGATTMEQLRENIASIDVELDGETRRRIDSVHQRFPNPCP